MANRFWVAGTDTWDNNQGSKWAASSGGLPTASAPTSSDNVIFDSNSGMGAGVIVTIASTAAAANVTITGPAVKNMTFALSGNPGTFGAVTFGGGSTQGVNRLLVRSDTNGTQRTITASSYTISGDIDFTDINLAYTGAASWTNTGSKFIGDCGGNGGAVTTNKTTSATQTSTGTASFTWSTHGWTSRVPLPQDNVVISNAFVAGRTITQDMPRAGANLTMSGLTGSPTFTAATIQWAIFGNLTLGSGTHAFTWTSTAVAMVFGGRGSQTITSAGNSINNGVIFAAPGGTYTLQDTLTATSGSFSLIAGTFDANGKNVNANNMTIASGTTWTQGGAGTIESGKNTTGTVWSMSSGATANTFAGSTFSLIGVAGGITLTFAGGGKTYGTLKHVAMNNMTIAITGNNTFSTIDFENSTNASTITLPASGTQIVTTAITLTGTSGHLLSLASSSPGTTTTIQIREAATSTRSFHSLSSDIAYQFLDSTSATETCTFTTAGVRTRLGSVSMTETFTLTTAGFLTAKSATTTPLTFTLSTAGVRTRLGSTTMSLTDTITTAGKLTAMSSTTFPIAFTYTTAGVRTRFGSSTVALTFTVTTDSTATHFGSVTFPISFSMNTAGTLTAKSMVDFPITYVPSTTGRLGAFSSATMTETIAFSVSGARTATSSVTFPITVTTTVSSSLSGVTGTITHPAGGVLVGPLSGLVASSGRGRLTRSADGRLTKASHE